MEVTIQPSGDIVDAAVRVSSGNAELDKRAQAIVMSAGKLPPVPPTIVKRNEQMVIFSKFSFKRDAGFTASVEANAPTTQQP